MEFFLSAIALLLLLLAGGGVLLLLVGQRRKIDALEFGALAFLFGCAVISLSSFLLGWIFSGIALRSAVSLLSIGIFSVGFLRARRARIEITGWLPRSPQDYLLFAIILAPTAFLLWFCAHTGLGWDGVFHWEIKARLTFENGGALPLSYLTEKNLWSSHRGYPLLLPLCEAWIYGWVGIAHQGIIKLFFPLFFAAALCLLATAEGKRNLFAPLLLIFVPLTMFGDGSLSAGYADFLLASYFLGAVIYLLRYAKNADGESLRIFAAFGLCLPWTKQEGNVLLPILIALLALTIWQQKNPLREKLRCFIFAALPGLIVLLGWNLFVKIFKTPVEQYYLTPTLGLLQNNLSRVPTILSWLRKELIEWNHWGILWLAFPIGAALQILSKNYQRALLLTLAVVLPLLAYLGIYLFVATDRISLEEWLLTSMARLMLHVAPTAILLIATAMPDKKSVEAVPTPAPIVQ